MTLYEQIRDEALKGTIDQVDEFCKAALSYSYVYGYKDHGYSHSKNVINTLDKILDSRKKYKKILDQTMKFRLIVSCYLHDIGMLQRNDESYEQTIHLHNLRSQDYIDKYQVELGIDKEHIRAIKDICYAHSNLYSRETEQYVSTLDDKDYSLYPIRSNNKELAAIVRIANLFSLKVSSNNLIPQTIYFQKDNTAKLKWLLRKNILNVKFPSSGEIIIDFNWNFGADVNILDAYKIYLQLGELKLKLQKRLDECKEFLHPSITFHQVECNLGEFHRSLTIHGKMDSFKIVTESAIKHGSEWLSSKKDKAWGSSKESRPRVSSTAKAIIAFLDHNNSYRHIEIDEIKGAFNWLTNKWDKKKCGFPARSFENCSSSAVHSTAMAVYLIALLHERKLLKLDSNSEKYKITSKSVQWLIKTKQEKGWGNWENEPVRVLCTFWALRALKRISNISEVTINIDFHVELNKMFGSFLSNESDSSMTSCYYLILINELIDYTKKNKFKSKIKKHISKLIAKMDNDSGLKEHIENYYVLQKDSTKIGPIPWTHHVPALAIFALSSNISFLTDEQMPILFKSILAMLNSQDSENGNFISKSINDSNLITPTYESLNALNKILEAKKFQ